MPEVTWLEMWQARPLVPGFFSNLCFVTLDLIPVHIQEEPMYLTLFIQNILFPKHKAPQEAATSEDNTLEGRG